MSKIFKKFKSDHHHQNLKRGFLTEQNVGITEFIGKQKPFIAVLKHRFEDFVVHEIDKKGNVVKLESIDPPEDFSLQQECKKSEPVKIENLKIDSSFKDVIDHYVKSDFQSPCPMLPIDTLAKEERGQLHLYIRQNYTGLESTTETIGDKKFVKIISAKQATKRFRKESVWPGNKQNYVHFVLYKENLETVQVVNELSRRLGSTTKNFTFAGSKDKRAITTQKFCAFKTNPLKIWKAANDFNRRSHDRAKIHVGHFQFNTELLRLGDLNGNKFEIILRRVRLIPDEQQHQDIDRDELKTNIEQSLDSVKNLGFINYFGMQRFGSHRIDSHKLGILILRKEFKKLVEEILKEKPIDMRPYNRSREISFNEAIRIWRDTGDAGLAYKKMNYKYTIEGSLLRALTKVEKNDFHGALCIGLARNSRLLYLHAYQSYLWNRIASFRIREYGLQVVVGDLVFVGPDFSLDTDDALPDDNSIDQNQDGEEGEEENLASFSTIKANIPNEQIVLVNDENLKRFTIYDVVLPIIGSLSKMPNNRTKNFIDDLMKEDNVSIEQFSALGKQWCVNGSYRKLIVKPMELSWKLINYIDDTKPLIITDLDRIKKQKPIEEENILPEGDESKIALKIDVTLPTSCYATIFLREITKISSLSLENKPWQQEEEQEELPKEQTTLPETVTQ